MTDKLRVGGGGATPSQTDKAGTEKDAEGFQRALEQRQVVPGAPPRTPVGKGTSLKALPAADTASKGTPSKSTSPDRSVPDRGTTNSGARVPTATPRQTATEAASGQFSGLGARLVDLRRSLGVTQGTVAALMGSTQPALARLEKGDMKPNLRTLARYGEAIGQRVQVTMRRGGQDERQDDTNRDSRGSQGKSAPPSSYTCLIEQVPETLAQARRELGLTQTQVAAAMDTSQPVIARLEAGEAVPNLRTLERYCDAIGVEAAITFEASTADRPTR